MKPRIRKRNGLWRCSIFGARPIGIGYTPAQAYRDWEAYGNLANAPNSYTKLAESMKPSNGSVQLSNDPMTGQLRTRQFVLG